MSNKPSYTKLVTPAGIAQYPRLSKPDTKFNSDGEYKVTLVVPEAKAQEMITLIDEEMQKSFQKAKEENKGKKIKQASPPYTAVVDDDGNETGEVSLTFKMKAKIKTKSGTIFEQKPLVVDSKKTPLKGVNIGGGSTVKVAAELAPYYTPLLGSGVSLRLKAVQVLDLVEFNGSGGADAFDVEDGFEAVQGEDDLGDSDTNDEEDF